MQPIDATVSRLVLTLIEASASFRVVGVATASGPAVSGRRASAVGAVGRFYDQRPALEARAFSCTADLYHAGAVTSWLWPGG